VEAVEFHQGWSVPKNKGDVKKTKEGGLSPQEGDVRKRKEDDQGRWSVTTRRGREKVPGK
jgi:hypothetical protein